MVEKNEKKATAIASDKAIAGNCATSGKKRNGTAEMQRTRQPMAETSRSPVPRQRSIHHKWCRGKSFWDPEHLAIAMLHITEML